METLREYLKNNHKQLKDKCIQHILIDFNFNGKSVMIDNTQFGIDSFLGGSGVKVDDYLVTMEYRGKLGQENVQIVQCVKKFIVKTSLEDFGHIFMSDENAYDSFEMINADINYHRQALEKIYDALEETEIVDTDIHYALGDIINLLELLEIRKGRK